MTKIYLRADATAPENKTDKSSFMQQLDEWTETTVIDPLLKAFSRYFQEGVSEDEAAEISEAADDAVKKAIREKVLESYRNGQAAGPQPQQRLAQRFPKRA